MKLVGARKAMVCKIFKIYASYLFKCDVTAAETIIADRCESVL